MRKFLVFLAIVVFVVTGGLFAGRTYAPCSPPMAALAKFAPPAAGRCVVPAASAQAEPAVPDVPPPAVTVIAAQTQMFVDRLFVSGTLVARDEALAAAQIDGLTITEVLAEDGDRVRAGQVLARLDRSQLDALLAQNDATTQRADAAIEQAQSQIDQAQPQVSWAADDYSRAQKLGGQVIAAATIEQRQTTLKTAEAQLATAKHALAVARADRLSRDAERRELMVRIARTEVKAPVDGVVSRRSANVGATAAGAGDPLFRIIANGAIDLDADVPEQSIARLAVGMPVKIQIPGVSAPVDGKVRLISQEIDKASRTGKVRIALGSSPSARIGAFASGEISVAESQGLSVPATAVQRDAEGAQTMIVKDNVVEARKVTLGILEGDAIEVKAGLDAGDLVIARAAAFLRPGDRVRAVAATAALNN
jgi:RND family efflux transporter MFP subunit